MGNVHQFLAEDIGRSGCSASPLFLISNVKNKYMKKSTTIIWIVLMLFGGMFIIGSLVTSGDRYKEHLGERYVIGGDTLKIIDYSEWESSYTLEDGTEIHEDLIVKP